jgi:endoglucanase
MTGIRVRWRTVVGLAAPVVLFVGVASADDPAPWMRLWGKPEIESGQVLVERDGDVWATGPASMRLDMSPEPTNGVLSRGLALTGGVVKVGVQARLGEGVGVLAVAVNLIGEGGGSYPMLTVTKVGEWQAAEQSVSVPPGIGMAFLSVSFTGQGKAWMDDLRLEGVLDVAQTGKLNVFGMPFGYAYGSFDKHATVADGVAHIEAADGRGGAGYVYAADLSPFADQCPTLTVKLGPRNQAKRLRLILDDVDGDKRQFEYELGGASADQFATLMPVSGWAVSPMAAAEPDAAFDPAHLNGHHLQGAWTGEPVDVHVREIAFAAPTPELLAQREAAVADLRRRVEQEAERQRLEAAKREQMLTEGAPHPADGPEVQRLAPVAPDILAVTVQERWVTPGGQRPYEPQEGDEVREAAGDQQELAWDDGVPALVSTRTVWRSANPGGPKEKLGILVAGGTVIRLDSTLHGVPITADVLTEPRAYRLQSPDDAAYAAPANPEAVYRKSKPLERADNGQSPVRHVIFLKLPRPLQEGARYNLSLWGLNTRQADIAYTHSPREVCSDAIHVSQIGYRPSDPFKRAYLSTWLGTGGRLSYAADRFELVDADSGRTAYTGQVRLGIAADQAEMLQPEANHTGTDCYYLDFHDFRRPGTYRVFVPGAGVSYPFRIADDVWLAAFRTSMHGLLCHRSGIALGPPVTDYVRPRPFHPEEGVKLFRLDITMLDGESDAVNRALRRLLGSALDPSALATNPNAWGGYMDAGDWDRRSPHLRVSYLQLELCAMFPRFFSEAKLALPGGEAGNRLPDLLDEALWNIDFYRRLQEPDGGVGGGVESTAHPRPGEASWQESLLVGAFAPDPKSSYLYAATAARATGVLMRHDPGLADEYRGTAEAAWRGAEANGERVVEEVRGRGGRVEGSAQDFLAPERALAAVELYRLTSDAEYGAAFRQSSALVSGGDPGRQLDATFAYASLDDRLADADLKAKALDWLTAQGEQALLVSSRNSFNIAPRVSQLPMIGFVGYFTTPETIIGPLLPRLHYLTGDEKWLAGALAATQYTAGANPLNATMTTGLGHDYPRAPLHVDSLRLGVAAPVGITIYGPHDPTRIPDWVRTWIVGPSMTPPADRWPAAEFHVDVSGWPEMSEYTVHQSIGPTGYHWGYLAARAAGD